MNLNTNNEQNKIERPVNNYQYQSQKSGINKVLIAIIITIITSSNNSGGSVW